MVDVRVGRCENAQNDEKLTRLHPHSAPFKKLLFYSAGNFNYTPADSVSLSVCLSGRQLQVQHTADDDDDKYLNTVCSFKMSELISV